jgi:hypothetical protein
MPSVFRHLHTANSAATLPDVKLEQERTPVLTPISTIILEILVSFPLAIKYTPKNPIQNS